ncbi:uncharacterized protein LOC132634769 isoform X2 [Lycium barbarum]|uniref:uncharacterized protein LOC132634769 isoform X2 n=1 Tax=Lycium barbarum TaxID=112863 RepID=UPI00293E8616|nr:uncharacterized protein LOC132634769 isoform X2 [Lycium barbarum]
MEPPEIVKLVGRPKTKRNREPDKASLRKRAWKESRKGTLMRCNKCGDFNQNNYEGGESYQGRKKKTSSQRSRSQGGQNSKQSVNLEYEAEAATQQSQTQQSTAYGPEIGNEEDPPLRPMVISETQAVLESRSQRVAATTGNIKIAFKGDAKGVSIPSDLPYSPKKITWKVKEVVTTGQLQAEARKKKMKQLAGKGKCPMGPDDDLV